ncbi:MAG: hypothetical protein D3924_02915 [Candidatus Electrothrix sp. AR4]|nr:hypothetical protein [Candidatus Electrothrix sp. AR4]
MLLYYQDKIVCTAYNKPADANKRQPVYELLLFMVRNSAYILFWIVFQPEFQVGKKHVTILYEKLLVLTLSHFALYLVAISS